MSLFDDIKQFQSWKRIENSLLKAKSFTSVFSLDEAQTRTLADFDEFIEHNELGLAYDSLIYLSETVEFPTDFWREMLLAAKEMKLEDEIKRCEFSLK